MTIVAAERRPEGVAIRLRPEVGKFGEADDVELLVIDAPVFFEDAVLYTTVQAGKSALYVADVRWAEYVGRKRLRLVQRVGA